MIVTEKQIKGITVYNIFQIATSLYGKYCNGVDVAWVDGLLIHYDEVEPTIFCKKLVDYQEIHLKRVFFCFMPYFPKELKNSRGQDIQILDASPSFVHRKLAEFLHAKYDEGEQESVSKKNPE